MQEQKYYYTVYGEEQAVLMTIYYLATHEDDMLTHQGSGPCLDDVSGKKVQMYGAVLRKSGYPSEQTMHTLYLFIALFPKLRYAVTDFNGTTYIDEFSTRYSNTDGQTERERRISSYAALDYPIKFTSKEMLSQCVSALHDIDVISNYASVKDGLSAIKRILMWIRNIIVSEEYEGIGQVSRLATANIEVLEKNMVSRWSRYTENQLMTWKAILAMTE